MLAWSALQPGDRFCIESLSQLPASYRQQLMSLGLTPGVSVEFVRRAPLGDPIQIRVRGASLCVRLAEIAGASIYRES